MKNFLSIIVSLVIGFAVGQSFRLDSFLKPQNPSVLVDQAFQKYDTSRTDINSPSINKAVEYCEKALSLTNHCPEAHQLLATIYMEREEYVESLRHWSQLSKQEAAQVHLSENAGKRIKSCVEKLMQKHLPTREINGILSLSIQTKEREIEALRKQIEELQKQHDQDKLLLAENARKEADKLQVQINNLNSRIQDGQAEMIDLQKKAIEIQSLLAKLPEFPGRNDIAAKIQKITDTDMVEYTVKTGDTISKIASTYNISVEKLVHLNRIDNPHTIPVGRVIFVPVSKS